MKFYQKKKERKRKMFNIDELIEMRNALQFKLAFAYDLTSTENTHIKRLIKALDNKIEDLKRS